MVYLNDITFNQRQQWLDTKVLRNAQRFIPRKRYASPKENNYTMIKNIKILGLLAVLILTGCEKDKNKIPSGTYLTKVIYHQNVDQIRHYYSIFILNLPFSIFQF